ncbi:glucose-1-phosphate cytidylyltransferase [Clostridium sp. JS66]|uniref:glucose-1-phosphate cytidylyltransferase n=1 Tax=Clostridium sp. JS66 TaxID=3064705 RepID=UPI00298E2CD0|nr:glucose-1-phosphate cytidylyltransferase [Clostridium sp. JS66]WPC41060.1 glucose-1-phosphate cytidylyltransferase [Clostridium sp. JS66]
MKAVILAGGYGTRITEETELKPKPMIEIGGYPILWHIMKEYSYYGINDFIICLGYKGYAIKEYFANYFLHQSDVTFDMENNKMEVHNNHCEPWKVTLVDTGEGTMTGGRLKRVKDYIANETFCFTYGDGVSDVNIEELIQFHNEQKKSGVVATLTAVNPPGRYGALDLKYSKVNEFKEKPQGEDSWINGGYFVLEPEVINYIKGDETAWELEPLEAIAKEDKLSAFKHSGFWLPMDTLRDKMRLEDLWNSAQAPWKVW